MSSSPKTNPLSPSKRTKAVVIQDVEDYREKVRELLYNYNKFKKLETLGDQLYHRFFPRGARAGVFYGLTKTHKDNTPIPKIISAVDT